MDDHHIGKEIPGKDGRRNYISDDHEIRDVKTKQIRWAYSARTNKCRSNRLQ